MSFRCSMIDLNIIFVKDILNMNGTIKTNIFNELTIKVNYFSDLYCIKKALYKNKPIYLNEHNVDCNIVKDYCKIWYKILPLKHFIKTKWNTWNKLK